MNLQWYKSLQQVGPSMDWMLAKQDRLKARIPSKKLEDVVLLF